MRRNLILTLLLAFWGSVWAQCPPGQDYLEVLIVPDQFPQETTWELYNGSGALVTSGTTNNWAGCVDTTECMEFVIYDTFGDGICCAYGNGSYTLVVNGDTVTTGGAFTYQENVNVGNGCGSGISCAYADTVTAGSYQAMGPDQWYIFIPPATGTYYINTCLDNCDTKIWVYDHCNGLYYDNTNAGTIYYSDNQCGLQSEVWANLAQGTPYWIRIGGAGGGCAGDTIDWSIGYQGPVVGCTDPLACNYEPLATVTDTCYYPGDSLCPDGPDLMVVQSALESSMYLSTINSFDNCLLAEGCVSGYGTRDVLRFTTHIKNIGTQDYYIGQPSANPGQFSWDNCHNHYHYEGYAEYILYDSTGQPLPEGFKNGFCVMDLECSGGGTFQYGCGDMGISNGCGDIYDAGLDCQWMDLTSVPAGKYTLVVRVNWDQSPDALGRYESDYDNNWAQVCFELYRDPTTGAVTGYQKLTNCPPPTDCMGIPFGSAVKDCNGDCGGTALMGDLDNNLALETFDAETYVDNILQQTITPTNCNDLNADGDITVYDAMLVDNCVLFGGTHTHGGGANHNHCKLPGGMLNPYDNVTLSVTNVNYADQYVEISMYNPDNHVVAYQFAVSGMDIDSVVSMVPQAQWPVQPLFNSSGMIIGASHEDSLIVKNSFISPLCRIYFSQLTDTMVCITEIVDIVNGNYEQTNTTIGTQCNAVSVGTVAPQVAGEVKLYPNPSAGEAVLSFDNPGGEAFRLEILDVAGRVIRVYEGLRGNRFVINQDGLTDGMYFFRLQGSYSHTGKMVISR